MVGHFGAHNKGQKPCANEQFILPSSFYPYSFSLYTSTYSTANYYKCERTCPIQPSVETYILQSTCVEQAHKFVVETFMVEHVGVHHKGHMPFSKLDCQWKICSYREYSITYNYQLKKKINFKVQVS